MKKFKNSDEEEDSPENKEYSPPRNRENPNEKYLTSTEKIYSDIPYEKNKENRKVHFSKKVILIDYNENSTPEEIKITDNNGKLEKYKNMYEEL